VDSDRGSNPTSRTSISGRARRNGAAAEADRDRSLPERNGREVPPAHALMPASTPLGTRNDAHSDRRRPARS
jgi:hypothetical protein